MPWKGTGDCILTRRRGLFAGTSGPKFLSFLLFEAAALKVRFNPGLPVE